MSFLDNRSLDRSDLQTVKVHDILIRAYDEEYEALAIAGQVGILLADISRYPKMRYTWWSILEEAARSGAAHRLITVVLQDPTVAGYHNDIREALETSVEMLPVPEKAPVDEPVTTRSNRKPAVGEQAPLWPLGQTLRVRFLDGEPPLHAKVEEAARQWLAYANLNFDFGETPEAEIRVSFKAHGAWAYVGTNALRISAPQPTCWAG